MNQPIISMASAPVLPLWLGLQALTRYSEQYDMKCVCRGGGGGRAGRKGLLLHSCFDAGGYISVAPQRLRQEDTLGESAIDVSNIETKRHGCGRMPHSKESCQKRI